jgi:hypothetical protein
MRGSVKEKEVELWDVNAAPGYRPWFNAGVSGTAVSWIKWERADQTEWLLASSLGKREPSKTKAGIDVFDWNIIRVPMEDFHIFQMNFPHYE